MKETTYKVLENPRGYDLTKRECGRDVEFLEVRTFFGTDFGAGVKLEYDGKIYLSKIVDKPIVKLSSYSWTGEALNALHYYGTLKFNVNALVMEGTDMSIATSDIPFFGRCDIDLTRELQQREIDSHYIRWETYRAGDRVVAFESYEQLCNRAKQVFVALFSPEWTLEID